MAREIASVAPGAVLFVVIAAVTSSSSLLSPSIRDQCSWQFLSCSRPSGTAQCRVMMRQQCNCSDPITAECASVRGDQIWNLTSSEANRVLATRLPHRASIEDFCDHRRCQVVPSWCSWGRWEPVSTDCRYHIKSRKQQRCCHPSSGARLNITCVESRHNQRLRPPDFLDCQRILYNQSDNRTAPSSSVKDSAKVENTELTYAYLAIGLFICLCFIIAFPYRHIYSLCDNDSPDSSNCSTPNVYEQVPMEVQQTQVTPQAEYITMEVVAETQEEPTPPSTRTLLTDPCSEVTD